MRARTALMTAIAVVGPAANGAAPAAAALPEHVSCGQVITHDTKLADDVVCGQTDTAPAAVVIGANRVTLDLNGHAIASELGTDVGIDDSNGYDRLTIRNGMVGSANFETAIVLRGASGNRLLDLTVGSQDVAIRMENSSATTGSSTARWWVTTALSASIR